MIQVTILVTLGTFIPTSDDEAEENNMNDDRRSVEINGTAGR